MTVISVTWKPCQEPHFNFSVAIDTTFPLVTKSEKCGSVSWFKYKDCKILKDATNFHKIGKYEKNSNIEIGAITQGFSQGT